ncbi:MAG TPA: alcohol dehydrogenase catalytic domain-containing protein [Actinomycetota bacterium]|nr:alcohol dehydrogenase catalytic domain-containing protein [Actinomycetota bacterium]
MKVAVLAGPRALDVVEEAVPDIAPHEVLVRVAACGVCASELDMWEGKGSVAFPWFPGHEVSGTVEKVGDEVTSLAPGTPVAVWVTERGYAEYVAVPAAHCFPARDVPLDLALGEPLACAVNAVELTAPALGDDVVIVGAGFMGNLVQKLVSLKGPRRVIVADTRPDALARAERLGADRVVDVARESLAEAVAGETDGAGADVSFEVTGVQGPLGVLGDVTRMSGKIAIVGYHQGGDRSLPLARWNWMAFEIVNAHFRDRATILRGMRVGMRLLTSGRVALDELVTHRYPLEDIGSAFETAHAKPDGFVKATVSVG